MAHSRHGRAQEHEPSTSMARIVRAVRYLAGRHPAWDQAAHVCISAQVCAIGDACTGSLWTGARGGGPVLCHRACHWQARRRRSSPPPRPSQSGRMACSWSWGLQQGNLRFKQFPLQQHLAQACALSHSPCSASPVASLLARLASPTARQGIPPPGTQRCCRTPPVSAKPTLKFSPRSRRNTADYFGSCLVYSIENQENQNKLY